MVAERRSDAARLARRIADVLVPPIMEEIVKVVKVVFQEQIAERICEQIADVDGSQVAEQDTEVSKTSNRDRTLQRAVEQIFDVPVPEMVNQLVEAPKTVPQDRIRQRTVEQIVDAPVPQTLEEQVEVFRVFSQDRIQQRAVEQTIKNPAISLAGMIVEMPVTWKTQQLVNTHVQHVVDTVEVEKPKLVKETGQKPIIQEKINQVTKHVEVPQVQFLTKVDDMPVVVQRQVSTDQTVRKTVEVPPLPFINKVVDNPVVAQRQISMVQTIQKTTEIPQLQCVDQVVDVPAEVAVQVVAETAEIAVTSATRSWRRQLRTHSFRLLRNPLRIHRPRQFRALKPLRVRAMHISTRPHREFRRSWRCQSSDGEVDMPVVAQRQVPMIPNVQKTVEVPQIQYIDKIVDAPVVARSEDVSVGTQTVSRKRKLSIGDRVC